ncbi:MAG TPA: periplasmic heavy metal sensor [Candidatus Limnocylindria bacterium]|jgi:Spy/CpxP family protein refolding chaperone|nr:periplasmic heavy metal sensor [Candidatus Limnocylindria bacterium]
MKTTHTFISLLAATLLLGSTPILAEDAPAGGGAGATGGRRGGGGGFAAFQGMSDEQRQALQQVNEETKELNTKLIEARKDLGGAIYAEKVDEALIRDKAALVAKVDADLYVARAKAFAKVRSKFTSEQIEALKNNPVGMGGRMGGGGGRRPAAGGETK